MQAWDARDCALSRYWGKIAGELNHEGEENEFQNMDAHHRSDFVRRAGAAASAGCAETQRKAPPIFAPSDPRRLTCLLATLPSN
jgi:hypothetical protein